MSVEGARDLTNAIRWGKVVDVRALLADDPETGYRTHSWQPDRVICRDRLARILSCHGGQFRAAQRLLASGPDLNYHPGYAENPPIEIAAQVDTRRQQLVEWLEAHGAQPSS